MDVFWLPFLTAIRSVSSAFVRRGSSSAFGCSPTGFSLISLHVELPSPRLGPVLHVNSLSFCLLVYLLLNTDGRGTTVGRDGRDVSSPRRLAAAAVSRPPLLGCFVEADAPAAALISPPFRHAQIAVCELPSLALLAQISIPEGPRMRQIKTRGKERRLSAGPSATSKLRMSCRTQSSLWHFMKTDVGGRTSRHFSPSPTSRPRAALHRIVELWDL